jgi:thiol-disulfide isomerase/thioredoxin
VRPNVANGGYLRGDEPTQEKLIRGFFSGELGSMQQGPRAGELAKDFELTTQSGDKTIRLISQLKDKPVVLIFGNFTCGPFRRNYPDFDEICRRFQDQATFLGVYVREAHPSDGWLMESNTKMGVKIPQPITMEERTAVATRCATELKYTMPLLVDTLDDRVGNMYSGMPARAYVIGKDGIVTYQSGRGPFGFKPAEMEQSLILTLMQ